MAYGSLTQIIHRCIDQPKERSNSISHPSINQGDTPRTSSTQDANAPSTHQRWIIIVVIWASSSSSADGSQCHEKRCERAKQTSALDHPHQPGCLLLFAQMGHQGGEWWFPLTPPPPLSTTLLHRVRATRGQARHISGAKKGRNRHPNLHHTPSRTGPSVPFASKRQSTPRHAPPLTHVPSVLSSSPPFSRSSLSYPPSFLSVSQLPISSSLPQIKPLSHGQSPPSRWNPSRVPRPRPHPTQNPLIQQRHRL